MKSKPARPRVPIEQLLTLDMAAEFEKARKGDTAAIQLALKFIHDSILFDHPMPDYARQYLLDALKAGSSGQSVDQVLGKNRKGRPNAWTDFDKRLAVDVIQGFMEQGESLDKAAESAVVIVAEASEQALKKPSAWSGYKGRKPTDTVLRAWYNSSLRKNK